MHGTFAFLQLSLVLCAKTECGYKQCPQTREGALNVHLIPHSHMDAGWVKTFDEYYYGTKTSISSANVQLIYHSVISELLYDKKRKFTFSETSYFWRWWKEQRPVTRSTFRSLVQEGRVEFAGGGWVQNDEATSDYLQIIDQYTWGLRKLNDTLGLCGKPKAAWQIDTYGHTREQASLLAQMGFDGLFIGRVDHKERESMIEEDRMEFIWRGSDVLGKMSDIMTHTLFNLYNPPEGFCFDILCNDEPIVDDPDSKSYNADTRVNDFIVQIERQAKYYDHDNILVTAGGDFTYQSAANWFINMDKLINHVNTHPVNLSDVNIFYSSPSCYLKAIYLHGRRDKAVFTERSDHMPYGSDSSTYWSGYYSSRPSFKYFIRKAHVFLQVAKQVTVLARMGDSYELHLLRHAVNLVVHHDAITGTSQQHVTNDFLRILSEAVDACTNKVSYLLSNLTPTWGAGRRSKNSQHFTVCHQLNISQCRFTETQESMVLLIYNPLSVKVYHHLCFPVKALHFTIRDFNDEDIEYQLVPLPAAVLSLTGRTSSAIQELCFEAENIPPLGYTSYYVTLVRDQLEENEYAKKSAKGHVEAEQEVATSISNEYLKISIEQSTGLLSSIQHVDGVSIAVSQNFHYYGQGKSSQQSGAYSFRPETQRPVPVTDKATYNVVRGTLIKEIRQRFNDWVSQVIRLYRGEEFVELEWIIGPVPVGTDLGKEVVMLFSTNISNSGEFFTDSNSRQMMKRTCWNETTSQQQKKSISSCYYPVTSRICIRCANSSIEMCVLNDRAQGGTSYNDGEIELMIHRRLLTDDGFGLEESLNEESYGTGLVVRGKHRILFGNFRQELEELSFSERVSQAARRWRYEPWLFFAPGEKISRRKWQNVRNKRYSLLRMRGLPRHIHILTLEPWKSGSVLLRLENVLEESRDHLNSENPEGTTRASHITVDLRKLFAVPIKLARETTLAANQWLDDARQMDWSTRYVYSGSDDGVTHEDGVTEDYDNKQTHQTDAGSASEEETQRRRFQKYTKPKRTVRRHRHKRAIVNRDATKTINVTSRTGLLSRTKSESNDSFSDAKSYSNDTKTNKNKAKSQKDRMHYSNYKKKIPYENYSSEESLSLRKISKVIEDAKTEKAITSDDDESDDITKSIYEMYYKVKPKKNAFKPFLRNPHLNHHTKNSRGSYPRKNVNLRTANRDAPKRPIGRLTDKRRNVKTDDYSNESDESSEYTKVDEHRVYSSQEDSSEDIQTNEEYWRTQKNRRKRTLQREESESEGKQDYLITLRPTQIRTFVVWFDNIKN